MTRRLLGAAAALSLLVACGDDPAEVAPPKVDVALAPERVGGDLILYENTEEATLDAFTNAGERSLASDGHIWELRRADRLIGTLQITTVLPKIDLTDLEDRQNIVAAVIPGSPVRRRVAGIEVYTFEVDDKATFVWFSQDFYEILQIKDRTIKDYEVIAADIIEHQATIPAFKPLTS